MNLEAARTLMSSGTEVLLRELRSCSTLPAPSSLPGWRRTHLCAHLGANAEALSRLADWARTGIENPMYTSSEQRETDIEEGADRDGAELRNWVSRSAAQLSADLDALSPQQWQADVRTATGRALPASAIPWLRAREVFVHAIDLDTGLGFADLPETFLRELISDIVTMRSDRAGQQALHLQNADDSATWRLRGEGKPVKVAAGLAELAGWLTGRSGTPVHDSAVRPLSRWL